MTSSVKQQLLDPVGSMCKLIYLNFAETNTKISIYDHIVLIQRPNQYQWMIRFYNRDGREDISELYDVIIRLIEWFIMPQNDIQDEIKDLVLYLCLGLEALQHTYKNGNVVLCLQFYINLLRSSLSNTYNKNMLPKCIEERITLLDYDKLKKIWDIKTIQIIVRLYKDCFNEEQQTEPNRIKIDGYLGAIDKILMPKDIEFKKLIDSSNQG